MPEVSHAATDESIEVAVADRGRTDERAASATEPNDIELVVVKPPEPTKGLMRQVVLRDGPTQRLLNDCNMSVAGDRRRDHLVKLGGPWLGSLILVWVCARTAMSRPGERNSRSLSSAVADKLATAPLAVRS